MEQNFVNNNDFIEAMSNDESLKPITDIIKQVMEIPDTTLESVSEEVITNMMKEAFPKEDFDATVNVLLTHFQSEGYTKADANAEIAGVKTAFDMILTEINPSAKKKAMLKTCFDCLLEIFEEAGKRFVQSNVINLSIKLDKGAKMPVYAHESDAAADLSALETIVIPAHSYGNKVKTGVHLQLPDGWQARALPRSSIGAKTPLRMSNSCAVIDTAYTGDVTILFDNISDSDYTINAGDRIAQLWVEPVYHFIPQQVDILQMTERNENGIGSTGR